MESSFRSTSLFFKASKTLKMFLVLSVLVLDWGKNPLFALFPYWHFPVCKWTDRSEASCYEVLRAEYRSKDRISWQITPILLTIFVHYSVYTKSTTNFCCDAFRHLLMPSSGSQSAVILFSTYLESGCRSGVERILALIKRRSFKRWLISAYGHSAPFLKPLSRCVEKRITADWLPEDGISRCRNSSEQKLVGDLVYTEKYTKKG